ncbi:MAG: ABC transporter ATP-binding protein [Bdellovibrionaceae bacterium]|nr:ABC transporter ATP-binding protein [Pseudobdellovibrionaceae bacterium]
MDNLLYEAKDLQYSYSWNQKKVPVLNHLNFSIKKESFCCFVGPSGTGKTTLLNILGLIENPTNGKLLFCGQDVFQNSERQKEKLRLEKVGFIFQSFYLIPTLTVLENTIYFLPSLGYSNQEAERAGKEVLDLMGLSEHLSKKPLELSGGQRQRVAIARAFAKKPLVILADEPTANLDSDTSEKIIRAFKDLQRNEKTSFIFSTHDQHLMSYAREIFHLKDGAITKKDIL